MNKAYLTLIFLFAFIHSSIAQPVEYRMPKQTEPHEGTWIQWPHNKLYGPFYRGDVSPTFIQMTAALQEGEKVHIIAYDSSEYNYINTALNNAAVPIENIDFFIYPTDDVWVRDNGPVFVYDMEENLHILDWGFNGWGFDTPYARCDVIPGLISNDIGIPRIDLGALVLEGGAVVHDGNGTMMATRSSIVHNSRNPGLSESEIEAYMTTYLGFTNFIWLDGVYGLDITDQHIDGFVQFANDSTIVTMASIDLDYWYVTGDEVNTIYNATNVEGDLYDIVTVPLSQNDVVTTYNFNTGTKGSYVNYYVGNNVVLVPTYNDPNDTVAINIIQGVYPDRIAIGVDVRNLYDFGGMIHCITQQQPITLNTTGLAPPPFEGRGLMQNAPNPFSERTIISFDPIEHNGTSLKIFNAFGQEIRSIHVQQGTTQIEFSADGLECGVYFYGLFSNDEILGIKKMVIKH